MKQHLVFLFLLLILTSVFADGVQPSGSGTEEDSYQVSSLDNLLWISTNSNSWDCFVIQTVDIDATDTQNWNDCEGFNPIGRNDNSCFSGHFDGQNHTIDSLYINRPNSNFQGLFGCILESTIENIGVTNVNISGNEFVGGIVGYSKDNSTIANCYVTGIVSGIWDAGGLVGVNYENSIILNSNSNSSIYGTNDNAGGLVGRNEYNSTISNCNSTGQVNGSWNVGGLIGKSSYESIVINSFSECNVSGLCFYIGGLIGFSHSNSIINDCYSSGNIIGIDCVGGLVGQTSGVTLRNCYSSGNVSGNNKVGGLVGWASGGVINSCFSIGNVNGTGNNVGGLVGYASNSDINNCYNKCGVFGNNYVGGLVGFYGYYATIRDCYCTGIIAGEEYVGGLVGSCYLSSVENSFWDIETSNQTISDGGTGKSTVEMNDLSTFTDLNTEGLEIAWDFIGNPFDDINNEDFWNIDNDSNNGYPYLTSSVVGSNNNVIDFPSEEIILKGNYPNPFNPTTKILFSIPSESMVDVSIYNVRGQKVKTILAENLYKGEHQAVWSGLDHFDKPVSSGVYFYKLSVNGKSKSIKKCLLLK